MRAALRVESLKLRRSQVGIIATAVIIGGMTLLVGGIMFALATGQADVTAKLGPTVRFDWDGLVAAATQIMGAGGLVGYGVVLAWLFAREFSDGTITGLFALPVPLRAIASAKLVVFLAWAGCVSVLAAVGPLLAGLLLGFGWPDAQVWAALLRQVALGLFTAVIATPVAWIATVTRSLLAGVGATVGMVALTQVSVLAGAGGWMPVAAPALWSLSDGAAVSPAQLAVSVVFGATFAALTCLAWQRLQLDR